MKFIDGKTLAEKIKDTVAAEIHSFGGPRPGLAIILVGERTDSELYVNRKEKQAKTVGIDTHVYRMDSDISQEQMIKTIEFLNNDPSIDAILVQLPLPAHLDTDVIINTIQPDKDVDGFTRVNLDRLMGKKNETAIIPPVYAVILAMLQSINVSLLNKHVILIANSDIFVDNLAEVLRRQGATVTLASVKDPMLSSITTQGDILISAIGKQGYIKKDMLKNQAIVIDIGITMDENGHPRGDADFESVKDTVSFITPVPGGVGPMTIAMAFWNTLHMFKKNHSLKKV
jgi:methylenetetrahydrofolate dehydrogenase (NADP+)/methenyltetrahydrofolate cyclohydrolase